MRKLSLVASMLGCMSVALLSPGLASAGIIATLAIDDVTDNPTPATTGFTAFGPTFSTASGNEVWNFAGTYTAADAATTTTGIEAFVVLLEPGSDKISDLLDITFVQVKGSNLITINGSFTSNDGAGPLIVVPGGAPTIVETGDWQDVSQLLQGQGFRNDIQVSVRSGESNGRVVPEPASMVVWSLIACGIAAPGLRRRWRAVAKAA
jgi:hypothetical protein